MFVAVGSIGLQLLFLLYELILSYLLYRCENTVADLGHNFISFARTLDLVFRTLDLFIISLALEILNRAFEMKNKIACPKPNPI